MKARNYQLKSIEKIKNLKGKLVLAMCPNGGKTVTTIIGLMEYLKNNPDHKILILAHSTNVIKQNFMTSLVEFSKYITFTWSDDLSDESQVHVALPAQYNKITQKYNLVVVDEAHENYLTSKNSVGQVRNIIKQIGAKNELLLTGTPSKFISEGGYDIDFVALLDMSSKNISNLSIELIETSYNWKNNYYGYEVKSESYNDELTKEAMRDITNSIINKIKYRLSADEFNKIRTWNRISGGFKSIMGEVFGNLIDKTIIVCGSVKQANDVNEILNEDHKSPISYVSHSDNDVDSEVFESFKSNDFKVLVVVRRGRLGYSDDNLYNIIDMSGTHNPDLIYQMFARVLRGNPSMNKFYYKLTTKESGMKDLTHMATSAALMLIHKDFLSTFNGKNFNGIKIPVIKKSQTITTKNKSGKTKSKVVDKLILPEFTNDVVSFMRNVIADADKPTAVYKMVTIGEVKRGLNIQNNIYPAGYWTKERCIEEAKKYKTSSELHISNRTVYQTMRDQKFIHEVFTDWIYKNHESRLKSKSQSECTFERTISLLEKKEFDKISDFSKKYPRPYKMFIKDNDEIKDKYFPNRKINKYEISLDECIDIAKSCKSRYDMEKNFRNHYKRLKDNLPAEIDKIFGDKKNIKGVRKSLSKEKVIEIAKNCKSRIELSTKCSSYKQFLSENDLNNMFGEPYSTKIGVKRTKYDKDSLIDLMKSVDNRSQLSSRAIRILKKDYKNLLDEMLPLKTGKYERKKPTE
jgi:superfamily II DNA or RNA helicase